MNAAVVLGRVEIVGHVLRLRVLANLRIVVGRSRIFHRAQRHSGHCRREETRADQPVGLIHGLPEHPLLHHRAEDVGHRLVQCAGLPRVFKSRGILRDAVGELMTDYVQVQRETVEKLAIPVAINHLAPVPESVVVLLAVVHGGIQAQSVVVHGIAPQYLLVEIVCVSRILVGFRDGDITRFRVALPADKGSGQAFARLRVIDRTS